MAEPTLQPERARRSGVGWGLVLLGLFAVTPIAEAGPTPEGSAATLEPATRDGYAGLTLRDALARLRAAGLPIVFTDRIVTAEMTVETEPRARRPRKILEELLDPHGLRAVRSEGTFVVVAASDRTSNQPAVPAGEIPPPETLPFVHDEILVRPSSLTLLEEEPAGPLSLGRRKIEALPQLGGDIFRSLTLVPGITANDLSARFSVRGGRGDETRIVLDGQELIEPFHLKDYGSALSMIAVTTLDRVDLTTGVFSADHGDRMGGVLDLTTRTVDGGRESSIALSILDAGVSTGGRFDRRRGSWLAIARRGSIDFAGRIFGAENPSFWDAFGKLEHDLGARQQIVGSFLRAGDALRFDRTTDGDFQSADTDYDSGYAWSSHEAVLNDRLVLDSSLSWTGLTRTRGGEEAEVEQSFSVLDRRELSVLGLNQTFTLSTGSTASFRWGWEGRTYDADYQYASRTVPALIADNDVIPPRGAETSLLREVGADHLGIWVADRRRLLRRVTSELGLRWDRYSLTNERLVSPRLNLAVLVGNEGVVRLGWGRFLQSQRPNELAVEDGERTFSPTERSTHAVLGYEHRFGDGERAALAAVRVELYREEIENPRPRYENLFEPFNFFPEAEPDRVRIAPTRSLTRGLEAVLRGALGRHVDWWASYSYSESKDRLAEAWRRRRFDQPHALALDLTFRLPGAWFLSTAWRYHTGWPTTPFTAIVAPGPNGASETRVDPGPLNSARLADYHRLDVRASREITLRHGTLTFFIDVQNLYNRRNQSGFDVAVDDDSRDLVVATERWAGLFPSFGATFRF